MIDGKVQGSEQMTYHLVFDISEHLRGKAAATASDFRLAARPKPTYQLAVGGEGLVLANELVVAITLLWAELWIADVDLEPVKPGRGRA